MAPKTRKRIHIVVELDVHNDISIDEIREYTRLAFKLARIEVPQWNKLSTTTNVEMLSYRQVS